jgi:arabinofuranosyltransferase
VFVAELLQRHLTALGELETYWWAAPLLALVCCATPLWRWLRARGAGAVELLVFAAVCAAGVAFAWSLLWASDDAYITFRYAENLVKGHGLVYNPGERVEGYTDFLWAIYAALAIALGGDPGRWGVLLNLASFVGVLICLERLGRRQRSVSMPVGIAVILFAANYSAASFATAALETMFAAFLATLALERADAGRPLGAGVAGSLAVLSHPDHGIFYVALGAALFFERDRFQKLVRYAIPFAASFLPYFAWRYAYYGDLMPNTFYAKSASSLHLDQGLKYSALTFFGSALWALAPLVVLGAYRARRSLIGRYSLLVLAIYPAYVIKVGGDFMLGRFFVPALPLWYLLADVGLRWLLSRGRHVAALALVALGAPAFLPVAIVKAGDIDHGVADERTFSPISDFETMASAAYGYWLGQGLFRDFASRGHMPKTAIFSIGMAGYYAKIPVFDLRGLTSRSVAHLPLKERGRPGHEKTASPGLLLEAGVELSEMPVFPEPYAKTTAVSVAHGRFFLSRYDPDLLASFPERTEVADLPRYARRQLADFGRGSEAELWCDLFFFEEYYFSKNRNPALREEIVRAAVAREPSLAGVESLLLDGSDPARRGWRKVRAFGFEPNQPPWVLRGNTASWLDPALRAGQDVPYPVLGRRVNSFDPELGNAARGKVRSTPFTLEGDALVLLVGGTKDPDWARVELLVEGTPVRSATGCDSAWLGRRVWNVRGLRGKSALLSVSDQSASGHVIADEIVEWAAPAPIVDAPAP